MIEAMTKTVDDRLKDDRGIESIVEGKHGLHSLSSILLHWEEHIKVLSILNFMYSLIQSKILYLFNHD